MISAPVATISLLIWLTIAPGGDESWEISRWNSATDCANALAYKLSDAAVAKSAGELLGAHGVCFDPPAKPRNGDDGSL